tara:strand:- start:2768 stop:4915 length:2148 start_codon:yes stop_codon:yes gene_type:complete
MIKTIKIKEPDYFKSEEVKEYKNLLTRHFNQPLEKRKHSKFPFNDLQFKLNILKKELLKKTSNKCAYCESVLDEETVSIDHFRPHYSAADLNGKIHRDHYWWLAFNWSNLYPVCRICNSNKKNFFPISKKRATVKYSAKDTLFNIESPVFIDPEYENPEEYFYYNENNLIRSETERGRVVIDLYGLNRLELVEARRRIKASTEFIFKEIKEYESSTANFETIEGKTIVSLEHLEKLFYDTKKPYLGYTRFLIRQFFLGSKNKVVKSYGSLKFRRTLKLKLKRTPYNEDTLRVFVNQFEINQINIKNYKSIDEITIDFKRTKNENAGWAILIGENGVGKSSTLSATLKTLIGRNYSSLGFSKGEVKRNQDEKCYINITMNNRIHAEVLIGNKISYNHPKDYFINSSILAFGPFKHSNKNNSNYRKFKGTCFVDNFFNPAVPLHNAIMFILQLTPEQFDYVAIGLLDLLMLENQATFHREVHNEKVWFQLKDSDKKEFLNELSDGYQSVITLGCNIIEGLLLNNESIENASGFVVIDEIGANLHPRWKMQIVKRLRRTFPNVQFLVTTHDPLCLKGIEEGETYVLKSNEGQLEVLTDLPNPSEYRADQLLTSEFFGLYSTVDPELEKEFKEYYELLYRPDKSLNSQENERLIELKKELREKNHLGDSFREELLYVAIDEILAKQKKSDKPFSRLEVEKEVKEKAIELIDQFLSDIEE